MFCDPLQKSTLTCPDTYCPSSNVTFAVCEYTIANNANNQTAFNYVGCPDTSHLDCAAIKNCAAFNVFVMVHGVNQTNTNGTKYTSRCEGSYATTSKANGTTSSTAGSATATSMGNMHQVMCNSILLFICFLTISMSKRLF